jgi:hypothetical protein
MNALAISPRTLTSVQTPSRPSQIAWQLAGGEMAGARHGGE